MRFFRQTLAVRWVQFLALFSFICLICLPSEMHLQFCFEKCTGLFSISLGQCETDNHCSGFSLKDYVQTPGLEHSDCHDVAFGCFSTDQFRLIQQKKRFSSVKLPSLTLSSLLLLDLPVIHSGFFQQYSSRTPLYPLALSAQRTVKLQL